MINPFKLFGAQASIAFSLSVTEGNNKPSLIHTSQGWGSRTTRGNIALPTARQSSGGLIQFHKVFEAFQVLVDGLVKAVPTFQVIIFRISKWLTIPSRNPLTHLNYRSHLIGPFGSGSSAQNETRPKDPQNGAKRPQVLAYFTQGEIQDPKGATNG